MTYLRIQTVYVNNWYINFTDTSGEMFKYGLTYLQKEDYFKDTIIFTNCGLSNYLLCQLHLMKKFDIIWVEKCEKEDGLWKNISA